MRTLGRTVALLLLTSVPACNAILGNESDYSLKPPVGASGSENGGADAAPGGKGASGGSGGSGGATSGGASGKDASAGGGGSGGRDAAAGGATDGNTDGRTGDGSTGDGTAIGSAGDPCSPNNSYACVAHASKGILICTKGVWSPLTPCSGSNNCDSTPGANAGSCQPIVPDCVGKTPGTTFCQGQKDKLECGIDLVSSKLVETCPFVCTGGACTGECDPTGTTTKQCKAGSTTIPQTCDASTGTWKDGTACTYLCSGGDCVAATCGDRVLNGNETDTDCGGSCGGCAVGQKCKADADCKLPESGKCVSGLCASPTCTDGVMNGPETGTDCGGGCPNACAVGQGCSLNTDCALPGSGKCTSGKCVGATCTDSVMNGDETGVDCGGTCPNNCPVGSGCKTNADCAVSACVGGTCSGVCSPTSVRCDPNGTNGVETCNAQGAWGSPVACTTSQTCAAGACTACPAGKLNCDSTASNGCEKTINSPASCGTTCSTVVCSSANGTASCVNGACGMSACNSGYGNCSNAANDGCETNLNSNSTCGQGCGTTTACAQPAPTCVSQQCVCPSGYTVSNNVCCQNGLTGCNGTCVNLQTNNNNCGGCGLVCSTSCSQGHCMTPVATGTFSQGIAADATNVYWTNISPPAVEKAPVGGGTPVTLASGSDVDAPFSLVADATNVYWTNSSSGRVMKVPIAGGTAVTLATGTGAEFITEDAGNVYWTCGCGPSGFVAKVSKSGGTLFSMASNQDGPAGIAVNAVYAYFTLNPNVVGSGALVRVGLGGGTTSTLLNGLVGPAAVALDANNVYFAAEDDSSGSAVSTIFAYAIVSGTLTPLATSQSYFHDGAIAVDANSVYWANFTSSGSIAKVPLGGGAVTTIASGISSPVGVALAGNSVFFSAYGGTVGRITPR